MSPVSAVRWIVRCVSNGLTSVGDPKSGAPPSTVFNAVLLSNSNLFPYLENGDKDPDLTGLLQEPGYPPPHACTDLGEAVVSGRAWAAWGAPAAPSSRYQPLDLPPRAWHSPGLFLPHHLGTRTPNPVPPLLHCLGLCPTPSMA